MEDRVVVQVIDTLRETVNSFEREIVRNRRELYSCGKNKAIRLNGRNKRLARRGRAINLAISALAEILDQSFLDWNKVNYDSWKVEGS